MHHILITGGSGLVGKAVTAYLERKGYKVAWLTRSPKKKRKQKTFGWDIKKHTLDEKALEWCDGIIHLAGANVGDKRWTESRKKEILESRTLSTRLLMESLQKQDRKPEVFISASGVNYYGANHGKLLLEENSPAGDDFLAQVVVKWETEVAKIKSLGIRTVIIRTGTVLSKKGGALPELLKPPITAPLGNGRQYMSWIQLQDLAALYAFVLTRPFEGVFNGVTPHPVTNWEMTELAAKAKGKPFMPIPVPAFLLNLFLGEMAQLVTGGSMVSSRKIQHAGFTYRFPYLKSALEEIYG